MEEYVFALEGVSSTNMNNMPYIVSIDNESSHVIDILKILGNDSKHDINRCYPFIQYSCKATKTRCRGI